MADAQDVPVFMRAYEDGEPRFLGRFPLAQLEDLVSAVERHGCFDGNDLTSNVGTQFICYGPTSEQKWVAGFELIIGGE